MHLLSMLKQTWHAVCPAFDIVGMPDTAVREARERVRSAYRNSGFIFPAKRITVNLAPASIRKEGSVFDLAILLGILSASGSANIDTDGCAFAGELSLIGDIRKTSGILPMVTKAKEMGLKAIFIPEENTGEAEYIDGIDIYPVKNVCQLLSHLSGEEKIKPLETKQFRTEKSDYFNVDYSEVMGQYAAKRAIEIARCRWSQPAYDRPSRKR